MLGARFIRRTSCRLKREEQRIAKEIEEREQEEARKLLEQAQGKKGVKKINIADGAPLDKATLMNQVRSSLGAVVLHRQPAPGLQLQMTRKKPSCRAS